MSDEERGMNAGTLLATFIGGAVAGAVLALLYAPMSGKRLKRKVAELGDRVADRYDDLQDKVRRMKP